MDKPWVACERCRRMFPPAALQTCGPGGKWSYCERCLDEAAQKPAPQSSKTDQSIGGEPGEQSDPQNTAGRKSARQIDAGALSSKDEILLKSALNTLRIRADGGIGFQGHGYPLTVEEAGALLRRLRALESSVETGCCAHGIPINSPSACPSCHAPSDLETRVNRVAGVLSRWGGSRTARDMSAALDDIEEALLSPLDRGTVKTPLKPRKSILPAGLEEMARAQNLMNNPDQSDPEGA